MKRPRHWIKLWVAWLTTPAHLDLSEGAFGLGPLLLLLCTWDGEYASGGWLLAGDGTPMSRLAMQRATHRSSLARLDSQIAELVKCGTLKQREDGAFGFPKFGQWQETKAAKRMRTKRERGREQFAHGDGQTEDGETTDEQKSLRDSPPSPPLGVAVDLPANDLPGEESPGLLLATSPAPKPKRRGKPRADVDDALVRHICDEMRRACRDLTGVPNAGPELGANGEPCSPTNRDHIAKCQAAHAATPEQWTRVIQAQLANVRGNGKTQYLTLSTICGPANFQRLLDMPPPPTRIGARPEIGPRPTVARTLELKPRREEPSP